MSVPTYRRKQGKLEVLVKARQLFERMVLATANIKKFDPLFDELFTKMWLKKTESAYLNCWRANNVLVKTREDYEKRKSLQNEALLDLTDFLALLSPAKTIFKIPMKRVGFWAEETTEVIKLIQAWKKSDGGRYGRIE